MPQERVPHGVTIVKLRQLTHPRLLMASLQPVLLDIMGENRQDPHP